jgi:hypothetical protein
VLATREVVYWAMEGTYLGGAHVSSKFIASSAKETSRPYAVPHLLNQSANWFISLGTCITCTGTPSLRLIS